jgi:Antitoxin VbhA
MPLIREENAPRPSHVVMEKAFEIAEASLRLEGMKPGLRYYELKAQVLAGEITADQAVAEMTKPPVEPVTLDKLVDS